MLSHADYLLIACVHSNVVTEREKFLDKACGTNNPLLFVREKRHEHLVVTFYFGLRRVVGATQHDFTRKLPNRLLEDLKGL